MIKLHRALFIVAGAVYCGPAASDAVDLVSTPQAAAVSSASAPATAAQGVLREERIVTVGRKSERWDLVWRQPPRLACGPDEPEVALTCPCTGFAYGEMGEVDLVRHRSGYADERLSLTSLFREAAADGAARLTDKETPNEHRPGSRLD